MKLKLKEQFKSRVTIRFGDGTSAECTGIYREVSDDEINEIREKAIDGEIGNADVVREYLIGTEGIEGVEGRDDAADFASIKEVILSRPRFTNAFATGFFEGASGAQVKNSKRSQRR